MNTRTIVALVAGLATMGGGCGADYHAKKLGIDGEGTKLTVGNVQRQIAKGMAQDKVLEAMGSPNIVSTDEGGREVWVYDRFASEVVTSQSSGGAWLLLGAVGGESGAATRTQRSLTVIIKYDEAKRVRDVAYHSSTF